jgi:anti-anti-sigma factor
MLTIKITHSKIANSYDLKIDGNLVLDKIVNNIKYQQFEQIIANSHIICNLQNISSIDSAGFAYLLEIKKICARKNSKLQFINVHPAVMKFCQLYQIDFNNL